MTAYKQITMAGPSSVARRLLGEALSKAGIVGNHGSSVGDGSCIDGPSLPPLYIPMQPICGPLPSWPSPQQTHG